MWEYARIVEGYRENGKIKQRVVKNLGPIRSEADREKFKRMAQALRTEEEIVRFGDLRVKGDFDFGVIYAVEQLWDVFGISSVLTEFFEDGKFRFRAAEIVRLLATHRLHDPSSDLAAHEWIRKEAFVDLKDIQKQHIYRTLDQLIGRKDEIEVELFNKLRKKLPLKADLVFYDLTSSYFEGDGPELAKHGLSRDHRPDKKQLVLALALIDGIPAAHEVFPGNTPDSVTLKHAVERLKKRFDIKRIIFVADRGLFTWGNLDFLDEEGYEYIIATRLRAGEEIEQLMLAPVETREKIFAKEVKREGKRRYILCLNKDVEREERAYLCELRKSLEQKLKELADSYQRRGRGKKTSPEELIKKAMKILERHKRLFHVKFDSGLKFNLNRKAWEYEKETAGRFLLVTTSDLTAKRAMESYKELRVVEQAFKEIKHFVDIRPIYHSKDRRVKAHVFVCVLAYLTETLIGRLISWQSARKTIHQLRRIRAIRLVAGECEGVFLKELTKSEKKIFKSLQIPLPEETPQLL